VTIAWPTGAPYKRQGEPVEPGEWYRSNWLGAKYELGPKKIPQYHTGDDIVLKGESCAKKPVYAIADGRITYAEPVRHTTWGNLIVLRFGASLFARYAHLDEMDVKMGDMVEAGQPIGTIGNAWGQLPYHLHLDISDDDTLWDNPRDWPGLDIKRIQAHYVDPLFWIEEHMSDHPPDTAKFLRDWLAARPNDAALVIASIPPQREPLGTRDAIETDIPTLLQVVTPPAPPPPITPPAGVTTTRKRVNTTVPLNLRSTPGGLVVGSLLPDTLVDAGEESGAWTHVYHPAEGWVSSQWLSPLP
jgi:murein DD-endopeptidase MepM/ murein hydrolase activator NlpD